MVSGANAEKLGDQSVGAFAHVRTSTREGQIDVAMREVLGPDQRPSVDGVNDAAGAEKRLEIDRADRARVAAVMQRRVGMRAEVRRHRDRADVDRAAWPDLRHPSLLIHRVAGKRRVSHAEIGGEMSQRSAQDV